MDKVYRLKDNIEFQTLLDNGFFNKRGYNFFKIVPGCEELKQFLLERYYLNKEWIEKMYIPNKQNLVKTIGLRYKKDGSIRKNKKIEFILNNWQVEACEEDDFWLGFSSLDLHDTYTYYNKNLFDKYFPEEIALLNKLNLIEEYEVQPIKNEG